jgi:putative DNA primase/helicase
MTEQNPEAVQDAIAAAEKPKENIYQAVERLIKLHPLEYEQVRETEARALGVRVSALDIEVSKKRPKSENTGEEQEAGPQEAKPWPDPVDGETLFNDVATAFKKYLALQKYQAEALALWAIFSYCIDAGNIAPKLLIYSPEKRCGKTTLLDVLIGLVWKPLPASNISPAAIYRVIESIGGTLVIDEADTFIKNSPEINGIINSGHRKTLAYVQRCEGDDHTVRQYSTWAPNIIAMIGKPADTIVDRSILIEMRRKKPDEKVERFIQHKAAPALKILSSKIARWREDNYIALCEADPETPSGLHDRAADNWRPLLAIADRIGGDCPDTARLAAAYLSESEQDEDNGSAAMILLADIQDIFETDKAERISTEDLLNKLHAMEDRPWPEWNRGKPISPRQISRMLKPFGIAPQTLRMGYASKPKKGYALEQFHDAFARYLSNLSVTAEQSHKHNGIGQTLSVTNGAAVTDENDQKALKNKDCYGVTDKTPDIEDIEERLAIQQIDGGLQ